MILLTGLIATIEPLIGLDSGELAGAIAAQLRYGRVEDVFTYGLHEYLTDMIDRTALLGAEIGRFYLR
jgi:uncharacterized membrane protein